MHYVPGTSQSHRSKDFVVYVEYTSILFVFQSFYNVIIVIEKLRWA